MNKAKLLIASGAIAALLTATPALADRGSDHDFSLGSFFNVGIHNDQDNDSDGNDNHGAQVSAVAKSDVGKSDSDDKNHGAFVSAVAKVNHDRDNDGDNDRDHRVSSTTVRAFVDRFLNKIGAAGAGVVTAVNGTSTFSIRPFGAHSTTTFATNASTTFRFNGQATTSEALSVGDRVIVTGTTSTSTAPNLLASIVDIIGRGFGFFFHVFVK